VVPFSWPNVCPPHLPRTLDAITQAQNVPSVQGGGVCAELIFPQKSVDLRLIHPAGPLSFRGIVPNGPFTFGHVQM
jgi:hypothetical protein